MSWQHCCNTGERILGGTKAFASGGHDEDGSIHMNIKPGGTMKIKFTPNKSGEFEFLCSGAGHKEAGLVGDFTIEE
ncbi:hypothetical protein [Bacillus sp. 2205SS5-2]|uniref:hypothetical protein n=1 Tax=Bacillus sp. 2205SS5-2 TaxID=3109031 RepID=UPI003006D522